jgi:hypothetical protein
VSVTVNGKPAKRAGRIPPGARVVIGNGLVRVTMPGPREQRAGALFEFKLGGRWTPATSADYGDWTYVGGGVGDAPTRAAVLSVKRDEAAVRWTFDAHVVPPDLARGTEIQYPFQKTVWLRAGDRGFYTAVNPLRLLPQAAYPIEHEVGFGGVFGPATIRIGTERIRTDMLGDDSRIEPAQGVAVATLRRDDSGLVRTLVPFPPAPVVVPYFDSVAFGGIFVHHLYSMRYGAYLHVAAMAPTDRAATVCRSAWAHAPAALLRVLAVGRTAPAGCGPA